MTYNRLVICALSALLLAGGFRCAESAEVTSGDPASPSTATDLGESPPTILDDPGVVLPAADQKIRGVRAEAEVEKEIVAYIKEGEYSRADELLSALEAERPGVAFYYMLHAYLFHQMGDESASREKLRFAIAALNEQLAAGVDEMDIRVERSMVAYLLGEHELARSEVERVLSMSPRYGPAIHVQMVFDSDVDFDAWYYFVVNRAGIANQKKLSTLVLTILCVLGVVGAIACAVAMWPKKPRTSDSA